MTTVPPGARKSERRFLVILNPAAAGGRAQFRWRQLEPLWSGRSFDVAASRGVGDAARIAAESSAQYDVLVAAGGDGTVNEVLNGILSAAGKRPALATLPLGTGNDIALQLGIPDPRAGMETIVAGEPWELDVIEVECRDRSGGTKRFFALMYVALGIASAMGERTTPFLKRTVGRRWSYTLGFLRALIPHSRAEMRIVADGRTFQGATLLAAVGNFERAGGDVLRLFPGARPDDARLEMNLVAALSRWDTLRCFGLVRRGVHPRHPQVRYFPVEQVSIETDPPLPLNFDGEVAGLTPATLSLRPSALTVLRRAAIKPESLQSLPAPPS